MRVFERIKQEARKEPKVIVLPELGMDKDGVVADAMARARSEGTAIPIGLTPEFIERSGKMDEFVDALAVRRGYALKDGDEAERAKARRIAERVIRRLPKEMFFATMMVELGYAHGLVGGRYLTSADVAITAKMVIGEEEGKIVSSIFFREPPADYPVFDVLAIADMVVNQCPSAEDLYRIAVTSAETFQALTGIEPRMAMLSYITGRPQQVQIAGDAELTKIEQCFELYAKGGHPWPFFQAQLDAALCPDVAKKKGVPFTERPADILISPNLMQANPSYKALDRLVAGGNSMFVTQGFKRPIMDLSRGDSAANIANIIAACSVQAQTWERKAGPRKIDDWFVRQGN